MADLPPVTEEFTADTGPWIASLEAAIGAADRFAEAVARDLAMVGALNAAHADVSVGVDANQWDMLATALGRTAVYSQQSAHALEDVRNALIDANNAALTADDIQKAMAGATAGTAAGAATLGGLWQRLGQVQVPLFGGAMQNVLPHMLAVATGTHMLIDGVVEFAGVLIPAAIALTAFGIAGASTAANIYQHMRQVYEVSQATGQEIYPLSGGFQKLANSVQPQVYQLFGEALNIAGHNTGTFGDLATSAGDAVDLLAARFEVAITQGSGMGGVLAHASSDLFGLGTVVGNVGGILGNFMKVVPAYAEDLLRLAGDATHVAESFTAWGPVQDAAKVFLSLHGAMLYAGLAITGVSRLIPAALTGVSNLALRGAVAADSATALGVAGEKAGAGLLGLAGGAETASALPWGWILTAAAGLGVFVYWMLSAKDATQQWAASLEQGISDAKTVTQGLNLTVTDQVQITSRLTTAYENLAAAQKHVVETQVTAGHGFSVIETNVSQARHDVTDLQQAQEALAAQTQFVTGRVTDLAHALGISQSAAQDYLTAAGVPMSLLLDHSKSAWAEIVAEVDAATHAYRAMGQTGGTLGADMSVLNYLAQSQYTDMQQLNKAWTTFLGLSTGLETGMTGLISGLRQIDQQAKVAGASFTGVNNASLTLRNSFEQQITSEENVIGGMRQAGASAHDLAAVISTTLKPAVDAGALANEGFRQQVYDLARQAGYTGPMAIGPLTRFVDDNATSMRHASRIADGYAGSLGQVAGQAAATSKAVQNYINWLHQVPTQIATTLSVNINASIAEYKSYSAQHGGYGGGSVSSPGSPLSGTGLITGPGGGIPGAPVFTGGAPLVPSGRAGQLPGGGAPNITVSVTVQGSVIAQQDLQRAVQRAALDAFTRLKGTNFVPYWARS